MKGWRRLMVCELLTTWDETRARDSRLIWGQRLDGHFALTPLGLINTARSRLGLRLWRMHL